MAILLDPPSPLLWLALTVYQEAGGESDAGKVAVAHVILNRAKDSDKSVAAVVFAAQQFSCWNTESPTRPRLGKVDSVTWQACVRASEAAFTNSEPDPTHGARFYLNEAATRAGRKDHSLPSWFDESRVTARIGRHTFLRG